MAPAEADGRSARSLAPPATAATPRTREAASTTASHRLVGPSSPADAAGRPQPPGEGAGAQAGRGGGGGRSRRRYGRRVRVTGAPGILDNVADPGSVISYTDLAGLKRMREEGKIVDGMLPKARAIEDALRGGVRRVHVISYSGPDSILAEVFTNEGTGTLVVADVKALSPAEQHG